LISIISGDMMNPKFNFFPSLSRSILAIIAAHNQQIERRTRLQKLAYLLNRIGLDGFSKVRFDYEYNGPYSREVSDALQDLISAGFLKEMKEQSEAGYYVYSYELTSEGNKWIKENRVAQDEEISRAVGELKGQPSDVLELSSRVIFLSLKGRLQSEKEAFKLAIQQNPDLKQCWSEAEKLIERIKEKSDSARKLCENP
jgi:uncharacterized protein YwgA